MATVIYLNGVITADRREQNGNNISHPKIETEYVDGIKAYTVDATAFHAYRSLINMVEMSEMYKISHTQGNKPLGLFFKKDFQDYETKDSYIRIFYCYSAVPIDIKQDEILVLGKYEKEIKEYYNRLKNNGLINKVELNGQHLTEWLLRDFMATTSTPFRDDEIIDSITVNDI